MAEVRFRPQFLHPRNWLLWLVFGFWYLLVQLPYKWQCQMGRGLGLLAYRYATRRRAITRCNIDLCFPELSEQQREALVKATMVSVGIAVFETGIAWFWPRWRLDRLYTIEGLEHLQQAQRDGVGVLLVAFHFTHTDIGGKLMGGSFGIDGSYRPHNNPVYDFVQRWGRERNVKPGQKAIPRGDVRAMVKAMRAGRVVWYAPDQDYGPKSSVFVPFFGVSAATVAATGQLARLGKARVIPFTQTRKADGSGYHLTVYPPMQDFPTGDDHEDARRVNAVAEACIREQPDQYLWLHRRFKTRPEGEPDFYAPYGVKPKRRS